MLFTERSIWTMIHGIGLGGSFLILFSSAFYCLWNLNTEALPEAIAQRRCRFLSRLSIGLAVILWLTVLVGTFVSFPGYRVNPPEGASDLSMYPKAALKANPDTEWLHSIGMELKEHLPWIPAMLMTAIAYVTWRHADELVEEVRLRRFVLALFPLIFAVVSAVALIGIFINKVAPLV